MQPHLSIEGARRSRFANIVETIISRVCDCQFDGLSTWRTPFTSLQTAIRILLRNQYGQRRDERRTLPQMLPKFLGVEFHRDHSSDLSLLQSESSTLNRQVNLSTRNRRMHLMHSLGSTETSTLTESQSVLILSEDIFHSKKFSKYSNPWKDSRSEAAYVHVAWYHCIALRTKSLWDPFVGDDKVHFCQVKLWHPTEQSSPQHRQFRDPWYCGDVQNRRIVRWLFARGFSRDSRELDDEAWHINYSRDIVGRRNCSHTTVPGALRVPFQGEQLW